MAEKRFVNKKIGSRPIFCKPDCNHLEFIHFIALYILISIERVAFRFAIKVDTSDVLAKDQLKNNLDRSYFFVNSLNDEENEIIKHLQTSMELLKDNLKELNISIIDDKDSNNLNAELFTPTLVRDKKSRFKKINDDIEQCNLKLVHLQADLEFHLIKKRELENLRDCFCSINEWNTYDIDNQYQNTSENSLLKEDIYDLNSINLNQIDSSFGISALESYENERKRIARDLHDSTVQNLTNLMYKTELCTKLIDIDSVRAKLELQTMIRTIKGTIADMRNIIYDLRPMSLDDLGLVSTIEKYINEKKSSHNVNIEFKVNEEKYDVLPIINLTIFRIVQEATNNAIKHGKAKKILIDLFYDDDSIVLTINDNGIGFNESSPKVSDGKINSGFGLSIMKERVLLLSGQLNIESGYNKGTKIKVVVPIRNYVGDK
ncbi:MAG: sensor histidine kinase [Anaerocolumna aminovalerica]|uniref:sensor histidine kinase n=1 Tax=Anaerocolumna aminovalerica TaxID=1527 RepID=UPI00290CE99B|nr:sensor histidine kinase [Anaerocolumna aminovalerica]MDU6266729.1 sensor histidine kinase [Anaerocolumna aminovalerica]